MRTLLLTVVCLACCLAGCLAYDCNTCTQCKEACDRACIIPLYFECSSPPLRSKCYCLLYKDDNKTKTLPSIVNDVPSRQHAVAEPEQSCVIENCSCKVWNDCSTCTGRDCRCRCWTLWQQQQQQQHN